MEPIFKKIVPNNIKGKHTDVEHSITLDNREEALDAFKRAYKRMLNVNIWHELIGFASAHFSLADQQGNETSRLAKLNDYIMIDIPGPGPAAGDGYDWVYLEAVEDSTDPSSTNESIGIRMRSCKNPNHPGNDIAHFFTSDATSTIIIQRKNNTVSAAFHGRNEVLNTDTHSVKDKIRNTLVGAGAMIGLSELQWATLIKSLLKKEV
ncbi:MAG: hypothetical protein M3015_13185 [Bacteroidota bacterium]|nr:hypothetical protein [Bacteroidota bacterium]